jgi:formylglycine-generating enzyme
MTGKRAAMRFIQQYILAAFLVLLTAVPAHASDTLDIQSTLSRPGVRLVAVEFYATWCKPCMEAIPRWKALHNKYRDQGLRLVVVNTRDPDGACGVPGWTPDDVICDLDGYIADGLGVSDLPSAFLWSWQGNLLTQRGHVDEVEKAIETYFTKNPRIVVQATNTKGKDSTYLRDLVRNEFSRQGKFTVVATEKERALAAKIRKESFKSNYNKAGRCKLGQEVSANSLVKASIAKGRLSLQLFSAESSCMLQSAGVRWNSKYPERSVAEGVGKVLEQSILNPAQKPVPIRAPRRQPRIDETVEYEFWQAIKDSNDKSDFESYLETYSNGKYSKIALIKIKNITKKRRVLSQPTIKKENLPQIPKEAREMLALSQDSLDKGKIQYARMVLKNLLKRYPKSLGVTDHAYFKIGESYFGNKKYEESYKYYAKLIEEFSESNLLQEAQVKLERCLLNLAPAIDLHQAAMVTIPSGEFWMGCSNNINKQCSWDEKPGRLVYLDGYQIDKAEVTVKHYKMCVKAGVCEVPHLNGEFGNWKKLDHHNHPINNVSWTDARAYCEWRQQRLPTEAEWEKAARGVDKRKYPWGNQKVTCDYTIMNQGGFGCGTNSTAPTCLRAAGNSAYGLCDMAGNVSEWTADWYDENFFAKNTYQNPVNLNGSNYRVLRGGSWRNADPKYFRSSNRNKDYPKFRNVLYGFRCAKDL